MRAFENLMGLNGENAPQAARKVLAHSRTAPFFSPMPQGDAEIWMLKDASKRSENYHDHSWDMMEPVLLAYSQTRDVSFLTAALCLATNWCGSFSSLEERAAPVGVRHMAWYDMAVGLRAYRLAYLLDAAIEAGILAEGQRDALWSCLLCHAEYLSNDANIVFHNNHGFFQAAGQLAMGCRFAAECDEMQMAKQQGEERFRTMLFTQFCKDGVHLEHSPDYHRMVHRTASAVVRQGLIDDEEAIAFVDRIERSLSWFVVPSGHIANLGDSEGTRIGCSPDIAQKRWRTPEMRFVSTAGRIGARPDVPYRSFEEGGYSVARIPAARDGSFGRDAYLLQQAGFHSRTHKHADTLGFVWHDRGRPILIDSGRYGYVGKTDTNSALRKEGFWYSDPNRVYCERTRAHNCLEFDLRDYPRRDVRAPGSLVGRTAFDSAHNLVAFEAQAEHFDGVTHTRTLIMKAGQWLVCLDSYLDRGDQPHDVTQWFHFDPTIRLRQKSGQSFCEQTDAIERLHVIPLLGPVERVIHMRGQTDPEMQGWWSPTSRVIEANDAVGIHVAQRSKASIATLLTFARDVEANTAKSDISASAEEGVLYWKDEKGAHRLLVRSPASGSLEVSYSCG